MSKKVFIGKLNCAWLQNGYKNFENPEIINIFGKSNDRKPRKHFICHTRIFQPNPGYVRTGKKQMRLGGESDPRNKALMKMFNLINIGERAGSGVPNIFNVWADEGWEEPVIVERFNPDRTVLSLSFKKSGDKKVTKKTQMQYDKILAFMEEGKEYGIWDFCELLNLKESRTKDILKELADYIEIIGGNKDRKYRKK